MRAFFIYIILLFFVFTNSFAQQKKLLDSLLNQLGKEEQGKKKVDIMNDIAFYYISTNTNNARFYAEQANKYAKELQYTKGRARAESINGSTFWSEGNFELALKFYHISAQSYLEIQQYEGYTETLNNIGEVFKATKKYGQAEESLKTALSLRVTYNLTRKTALIHYNLGELYFFQGKIEEANEQFVMALEMANSFEEPRYIAYANYGLGLVNQAQGKHKKALSFFNLSHSQWTKLNDARGIIINLLALSDSYLALNDLKNSRIVANQAVQKCIEYNSTNLLAGSYKALSRLDSAEGAFSAAFENFKRYASIQDSLYTKDKSNQMIKMQSYFEKQISDKEKELLLKLKSEQDEQIKWQATVITVLFILILITSIMAYYMYYQNTERKKMYGLLRERKTKIDTQHTEILNKTKELHELNQQLNDWNKKLETKVQSRTKQLQFQNDQLSEYAFINAHKLRAPVASILGLVSLLQTLKHEEDTEQYIKMLGQCSEELDSVIKNIKIKLESEGHI